MNLPARILCILSIVCLAACEPADRRPGAWLSGELVTEQVTDWAFSTAVQEVHLQTHPWYGVPHSVTVVVAEKDGVLYVPSIYMEEPKRFPDGKYWNRIVAENPNVEIRIGTKLYPRVISQVTDEEAFAVGVAALADKYPFWRQIQEKPEEAPVFAILRLDERG